MDQSNEIVINVVKSFLYNKWNKMTEWIQQLNSIRVRLMKAERELRERDKELQRIKSDSKTLSAEHLEIQKEAYYAEILRLQALIPTYFFRVIN